MLSLRLLIRRGRGSSLCSAAEPLIHSLLFFSIRIARQKIALRAVTTAAESSHLLKCVSGIDLDRRFEAILLLGSGLAGRIFVGVVGCGGRIWLTTGLSQVIAGDTLFSLCLCWSSSHDHWQECLVAGLAFLLPRTSLHGRLNGVVYGV